MRRPDRENERGAALLTVLLLVAVISVLAGTALERLRLATRLGSNAAAIAQARAYGYAAETLAITKVTDLLGRDPSRVTLLGGWSGTPFPLPVPGGIATATVTDGGNCFNINSLVVETQPGVYVAFTPARTQFARLMKLVGVPGQLADPIAAASADWIDSDDAPLSLGAEDSSYVGQQVRYRTARTLMSDVSELRVVAGVTPEIYQQIRPWVCALPEAKPSKINVNTLLPEQGPLFAMLLPDTLSAEGARQLLLRRPPQGYESTVAFWKQAALQSLTAAGQGEAQTDVTTTWFDLNVNVSIGGIELEQHGLIDAAHLPARIATRQWGEPT